MKTKFIPCSYQMLVEEDLAEEVIKIKDNVAGIIAPNGKSIYEDGPKDYLYGTVLSVGPDVYNKTKTDYEIGDRVMFCRSGVTKPTYTNKNTGKIQYFLENEQYCLLDAMKVIVKIKND